MARNARRNYVRDGRGRFASTPGGGAAKKPRTTFRQRQAVSLARQRKQTGRLGSATREAKARLAASRKKLTPNASPQQKAAVTRAKRMAAALAGERRIKTVAPAGVIRGAAARGVKKGLKGRPRPVDATPMGGRVPASQRPGSITSTLRGTLQALAKADAARIREIEGITGRPVRAPRKPAAGTGATVRAPGRRSVSGTLGDNLRSLAQSDARTAREMADLAKPTPKGTLKGGKGGSRKRVKGGEGAPKALVAAPAPAKPTRPTSKVLAPGRRRKVRGPSRRTPGTIAKPRGLKPGALAERRGAPAPTPAPAKSTRTVNRTRKQAARAQRARTRALIESTSGTVVGMPSTYREPAGGGQRWRFRRAIVRQANLFGGTDKAVALRIMPVAPQGGPAPGSRSARRRAGVESRKKMSAETKRLKTFRRVMGAEDLAGRKTLSVSERRQKREGLRGGSKRRQQSEKTQRRAAQYLDARRPY